MARALVSDELRELIEPDSEGAQAAPVSWSEAARRPQDIDGILFVLRTGIPWEYLPQEMGCGAPRRRHESLARARAATLPDRTARISGSIRPRASLWLLSLLVSVGSAARRCSLTT
jgi:transposase